MSDTNLTRETIELTCMSLQQKESKDKDKNKKAKWIDDERNGQLTVLHEENGIIPPTEVFSETTTTKYTVRDDGTRINTDGVSISKSSLSKEEFMEQHKRDKLFREVILNNQSNRNGQVQEGR